MSQRGRAPGLFPALVLGVVAAGGCGDSATEPDQADGVALPTSFSEIALTEEVCEAVTFEGLAHGTVVTNQFSIFGSTLTFTGQAHHGDGSVVAAQLRIYAGTHVGGPDFDLELPPGGECATCTSNMLVIQEPGDPLGATSDATFGGRILITGFPAGSYIESFQLADHEATEANAQLIVDGVNIAPAVQPDGVNAVQTLFTTQDRLITNAGALFILGNPPTQQGSEAIDNIRICRSVQNGDEGCTFTKGWYKNRGESTITLTLDGRTPDQQRAIFDATPGQPGGVTWAGGNNTLNLYQQLLAALNNLGGDATAGPADVDAAIAGALAITGGSGLNITLVGSPSSSTISNYIDVLSDFNEGEFAGWPHCDD